MRDDDCLFDFTETRRFKVQGLGKLALFSDENVHWELVRVVARASCHLSSSLDLLSG